MTFSVQCSMFNVPHSIYLFVSVRFVVSILLLRPLLILHRNSYEISSGAGFFVHFHSVVSFTSLYFVCLAISLKPNTRKIPAIFPLLQQQSKPWKCNDIYAYVYVHRTPYIYYVSYCISLLNDFDLKTLWICADICGKWLSTCSNCEKKHITVVVYPFFSLILVFSRCCFLCMWNGTMCVCVSFILSVCVSVCLGEREREW